MSQFISRIRIFLIFLIFFHYHFWKMSLNFFIFRNAFAIFDHGNAVAVKSRFSEKATKIWKNIPLVLTLLSKKICFVITSERFFPICGLLIMSKLYWFYNFQTSQLCFQYLVSIMWSIIQLSFLKWLDYYKNWISRAFSA